MPFETLDKRLTALRFFREIYPRNLTTRQVWPSAPISLPSLQTIIFIRSNSSMAMTALLVSPEFSTSPGLGQEWLWTIERYHEAIRLGLLGEDDRVELLYGKLIKKMPTGEPRAACLSKINLYLHRKYMGEYELRRENPVVLSASSQPEPDYVVADLKDDFYQSGHPTPADIHLVIEVAETSISIDRGAKAKAYAQAGIREYWIINLPQKKVELHYDPLLEDGLYHQVAHFDLGESFVSPFVGEVAVADLLITSTVSSSLR